MKRKIMRNAFFIKVSCLFAGIIILSSCQKEVLMVNYDESVKDLSGKWKIVSLTRNGEDLTSRMDISKFRLKFNSDGTYTLEDRFAFIVAGGGSFKLSDPQYPFGLTFSPQAGTEASAKFQFPVVKGKRQLSLNMSLGCSSNVYQFNFEREN